MGYFSNLAIELEEKYNIDLNDYDFDIEQYLKDSDGNQMDFTISQMSDYLDFKRTVEKEIENDHSDIPDDFRYFFYRLLPDIPPRKVMRYHMYVSTPQGNSVDLTFTDRYDYVRALYAMSKNDNYNVFFSLIPYRKKRKTKANATHAQGLSHINLLNLFPKCSDFNITLFPSTSLYGFLSSGLLNAVSPSFKS